MFNSCISNNNIGVVGNTHNSTTGLVSNLLHNAGCNNTPVNNNSNQSNSHPPLNNPHGMLGNFNINAFDTSPAAPGNFAWTNALVDLSACGLYGMYSANRYTFDKGCLHKITSKKRKITFAYLD